jgi:large exoprotein involved in heme utilization and adhesion
VTGGDLSNIDGMLRSTIPGANLFLINPAGFVFGENAALDVQGSFHVSSASNIELGNSGRFDAVIPSSSVLTTASPVAFGFLDNTNAEIRLQGTSLEVPDGKIISIVGGDITISAAQISAPGGQVGLVSMASTGEVNLTAGDLSIDSMAQLGSVSLEQGSEISVDESATGSVRGGAVYIKANSFNMDDSSISAGSIEQNGVGVDIDVKTEVVLANDSVISVFSEGAADTGSVTINAATVEMTDESVIETITEDTGAGGEIDITLSGALTLSGEALISSTTEGEGRAGDVHLTAAEVRIIEEAELLSDTEGDGAGGNVLITAEILILDDDAEIASDVEEAGSGGSVIVNATTIALLGESEISSDTAGDGDGGSVILNASNEIRLEGESGVFADSGAGGNSGTINLNAPRMIMNGGVITAESTGSGTGGGIDIQVNDVSMSNGAVISSESSGTGDAGNIALTTAEVIRLEGSSSVTSETEQSDGGNIRIEARELIYVQDSEVSATVDGGAGNGGNIDIDPTFVVLAGSNVTANAFGGNGGNITIVSNYFFASPDSQVTASSALGINGTVSINAPDTDISGTLLQLPEVFLDAAGLLREQCAASKSSSLSTFIISGNAGVPASPDSYLSASGDHARNSDLFRTAGGLFKKGALPIGKISLLTNGCEKAQ